MLENPTGDSVGIMCKVNKEYKKYVGLERGKKVLYMELKQALYGYMQSALLWYETFTTQLIQMVFKLNPYNPCVANKQIEGKQCTILWYVDDVKISHVNQQTVTDILKELEDVFETLTIKRGKEHTYVGMHFKIRDDKRVEISMQEYIKECVAAFKEPISAKANTPAKHTLFELDTGELSEQLKKEKSEVFHLIVSKLLYVSKRTRLDIDITISHLCTRTTKSTKGYWEKPHRLLTYLNNTIGMKSIIGLNGTGDLRTWADVSYGVHEDMKGHTRGTMPLGHGLVYQKKS